MTYLFEFCFVGSSINNCIHKWCHEREIDTFNDMGAVYADIYGSGEYRKIIAHPVRNGLFEAYATDDSKTIKEAGLERIYPEKPRALKTEPPCRRVEITLSDGFKFVDDFTIPSAELKDYFNGRYYSHNGTEQTVTKITVLA